MAVRLPQRSIRDSEQKDLIGRTLGQRWRAGRRAKRGIQCGRQTLENVVQLLTACSTIVRIAATNR